MTLPIVAQAPTSTPITPEVGRQAELHRVATEFEAILVRQLLHGSGVAQGAEGYADMAVDALAGGLTRSGGLGLARQLEDALARQLREIAPEGTQLASSPEDPGRTR
ncbi:MAG: hypothetical protein HY909_07060 [Deltaproteobacteria bacterium]|nr:hypothetical protein [Deltaproteobacteria bacterium]